MRRSRTWRPGWKGRKEDVLARRLKYEALKLHVQETAYLRAPANNTGEEAPLESIIGGSGRRPFEEYEMTSTTEEDR